MKTSELIGLALDWAVAKCEHPQAAMSATHVWLDGGDGDTDFLIKRYSANWSQGGPIIEREKIALSQFTQKDGKVIWSASAFIVKRHGYGPTPLIAAMRCYVAYKLGDEVDIPPELTNQ